MEEFKAKFEGDVFNRLQLFNEELVKWNRKFSFTSIPEHLIFKRLIAPSAWLGNYLSGQTSQDIVDFGTGFGIPGIPMLIADNSNKYLLIDSHTKKTEFMRHILRSNILINKDKKSSNLPPKYPATPPINAPAITTNRPLKIAINNVFLAP